MSSVKVFINHPSNQKILFLALWVCVVILYIPAYKAGFYSDFHGTLLYYQELSFIDYVNREGIPNLSLYQATQVLLYILISAFGYHAIPWFLLFTALHVLTGFLAFRFFYTYLEMIGLENVRLVMFAGIVLFLIHPIAAETVVWKAAFHYHTAVGIIFLILNWTLAYLKSGRRKYIWLIVIIYLLSSYMLELFYLTPVFVFIVICSLWFSKKINQPLFQKAILRIYLPLVAIWCLHLITYYSIYGKWIAHYEFDLMSAFTPRSIINKLSLYFFHIFSMEAFLPLHYRQKIFDFMNNSWVITINGIIFVSVVIWGVWTYRRTGVRNRFLFFIFIAAIVSCILVIPMWFNNVTMISNDHYYYLPSIFLMILFASLLLMGKKYKVIRRLILATYMIICLLGTFSIVMIYAKAARTQFGLLNNFKWQEADTVFFLNLPNNYNGVYLFPADTLNVFNEHLKVFGYDTIQGKAYDVASYNMQKEWDGAHVIVKDSLRIEVTPNQYGCWWWYRTLGASDYENEAYKFTLTNNGFSYLLEFKEKPDKGTVILIQQGDQWKEINMSKINEEQW